MNFNSKLAVKYPKNPSREGSCKLACLSIREFHCKLAFSS